MSKIYTSADQLIGHTPLLELTHIENAENLEAKILAKLEYFNPAGSVKDRIARAMIDDAEAAGKLKKLLESSRAENGWDGITVATLAMNSPVGVLLSAFLFGMLRSASISMSLTSQVTTEMISVLQGFIVMLVASPDVWNVLGRLRQRIGRRKQEGAAE